MIRSFILANKLKAQGELLVAKIKSNAYKNAYYSVNPKTKLYSFWSWTMSTGLSRIDSGLQSDEAMFKLILMGGVS